MGVRPTLRMARTIHTDFTSVTELLPNSMHSVQLCQKLTELCSNLVRQIGQMRMLFKRSNTLQLRRPPVAIPSDLKKICWFLTQFSLKPPRLKRPDMRWLPWICFDKYPDHKPAFAENDRSKCAEVLRGDKSDGKKLGLAWEQSPRSSQVSLLQMRC